MPDQPKPLEKMHTAIQLAAFHYIACLKATPSNADYTVTIGNLEFRFDNIRTAETRILHWEFQRWAASAVLRDLIEYFSIFLTEIYGDAVANASDRTFATTPSQFERKGIEDQLSILAREFSIAPEWVTRLTGHNRARNCLAHRAGVVGLPDATHGPDLVISWLAVKTTLAEGVPAPFLDVGGAMSGLVRAQRSHEESTATVELLHREKRVGVGSVLHFLPDEVLEICQTLQLASAAIGGIVSAS
ncbi:hypothetical protein [Aurantimonas sp. HBX-1]|uniref:hypothetical protein n=1 Tax=Aurantimonas sp. HBX-1 TaxID=2906072 RepID=UPI001F159198|nr:hypothetical protein [Aurantimonas sp. HBX-1]UIJ73220.1 hypothetical protein LXB15_06130 [Aurantimonas sp. HBX-1]